MSSPKSKDAEFLKLYNNLPPDIQNIIYESVKRASATNSKPIRESLALVNKNIGQNYQPFRKLTKITESADLQKTINQTVNAVGDFPIKTLLKTKHVANEMKSIFNNTMSRSEERELLKFDKNFGENTFKEDEAECIKEYGKEEYNELQQKWENTWNYTYTNPEEFVKMKENITRLQSNFLEYDNSKKTKKNMQEFIDLPANPTFKEYATAIKKLPFSVKLQMGL